MLSAGEIVGAKDCRLEGDGESFGESFTIGRDLLVKFVLYNSSIY